MSPDIVITGADMDTPTSQIKDILSSMRVEAEVKDHTRKDDWALWHLYVVSIALEMKDIMMNMKHLLEGLMGH